MPTTNQMNHLSTLEKKVAAQQRLVNTASANLTAAALGGVDQSGPRWKELSDNLASAIQELGHITDELVGYAREIGLLR